MRDTREKAFSLVETIAAVAILAFVCSGLLVVINRYMDSAVDSVMRMRAFEVARTNMEELLTLVIL
ncbi:MAG: prepilin-type N-terminal cleavage/methylation domain-containing protein [Planctomycetota bacterium]